MSTTKTPTTIANVKSEARRLCAALSEEGVRVSHSRALELIARQRGLRDWNTLSAQLRKADHAPELALGQKVRGVYLGHAFTGRIKGLREIGSAGHREVTVAFDAPIDVVRSESFSSLRRRVSCVLDRTGRSPRKTSDGAPILTLEA